MSALLLLRKGVWPSRADDTVSLPEAESQTQHSRAGNHPTQGSVDAICHASQTEADI